MTFDPQSLLDAVDAQRRHRGMTWQKLSDELGVSASTIRQMPKRRWGIELDGVTAMARWLGRTVESFAGGEGGAPPSGGERWSRRPSRFQTKDLFEKGGRLDVQSALNACQWLGRTIQSFQRET